MPSLAPEELKRVGERSAIMITLSLLVKREIRRDPATKAELTEGFDMGIYVVGSTLSREKGS